MVAKGRGTSRVRGSDVDAGVHLDTELGPVDVGLAVSETAVGVVIDAPGLGRLKAAFDVDAEGAARLTALSRESLAAEPFVAPIFELQALLSTTQGERDAVSAQLQQALSRLSTVEAERDAHAASAEALAQELTATAAQLSTVEVELAAMTAKLADTAARLSTVEGELPGATEALGAMTAQRDAQLAAAQALEAKLADTAAVAGQLPGVREALGAMTAQRDAQRDAAEALEEKLTSTTSRLEALTAVHEEKVQVLERTEAERAEARDSATGLAAELAEAKRTAEGLRPRLEHAEQLAKDLSEQLTAERRRGSELTARRFDAEEALAELTQQADAQGARAQAAEAEHAATVQLLRQTEVERDGLSHHARSLESSAVQLTDELARVTAQRALSQQEAERTLDEVRSRLQEVEQARDAEREKSAGLEAELAQQKEELARRQATLEEEQALRDEMVRDLAFIQSQVSDLSTTKGALVSRIDQMSKREAKRQKSSAEISDLLRDAEVVAADKQTTARRIQAHAGRLEEQLVELNRVNEGLQARLAAAEAAHAQLAEMTGERDRLKVDIAFFQKQIGALHRTSQARPGLVAPAASPAPPVARVPAASPAKAAAPPPGPSGARAAAPSAAPPAPPAAPPAPAPADSATPALPDEWAGFLDPLEK